MIGDKHFELSNHLGNVLAVISDKKIPTATAGVFNPDVLTYSDYYPFGMLVPNRHADSDKYRYGFNGKEKDDELKGEGNNYDFGARMLDPRIGRWFAPDKMENSFPSMSTYGYALNNPILFIDPDGNRPILPIVRIVNIMCKVSIEFFQAMYHSNNNSPLLFYNWASGKDKGDHWNTFSGAAGEAIAASYLHRSFKVSRDENPLIGQVEFGNYYDGYQIDVQVKFWTGKVRGRGLKGLSELELHYHNYEGEIYYADYETNLPASWEINYEVKTFSSNRKGGAKSLYYSFKEAFKQVNDRTNKITNGVGVLVTDTDAWMTVVNDKTYGPKLKTLYDKYVNEEDGSGAKLLLIKDLTKSAAKEVTKMYEAVKNE